jgi:hypothetical protein
MVMMAMNMDLGFLLSYSLPCYDGRNGRIVSYETPRDLRIDHISLKIEGRNKSFGTEWSMRSFTYDQFISVASNLRNQGPMWQNNWNQNLETRVTYERYHDYLRVFVGVNVESEMEDSLDDFDNCCWRYSFPNYLTYLILML